MRTAILAVLLLALALPALAADFVVVANRGVPADSLTRDEARGIFLGRKLAWGDGTKVVVVTQSGSAIHRDFVEQVTGKTPAQFQLFWNKQLFSGNGIPPRDLAGDEEVKRAVAAAPGGIGYVSARALDGSVKALELR